MNVNLLNIEPEAIVYFFTILMHPISPILIFVSIAGLIAISRIFNLIPGISQKRSMGILLTLFILSLFHQPINPIVYSLSQGFTPKIDFDSIPYSEDEDFYFLDKKINTQQKFNSKYDRILVFVIESVPSHTFEYEARYSSDELIFSSILDNSAYYTRYYTTNQDSLNSFIAMLQSRFVPYKSYSDDMYENVIKGRPDLIDLMNNNNYHTVFVAAEENPYRTDDLFAWSEVILEDNYSLSRQDCMCFRAIGSQKSCEDISLLDDVISTVENNEKVFLMQEFIYGHYQAPIEEKGIPAVRYYNVYMSKLFKELEKRGLLDKTLIVIVSDHGHRLKKNNYEPSNYNIPLVFWSKDTKGHTNDRFFSHLNFADLVLYQIGAKDSVPPAQEIFTVGANIFDPTFGNINDKNNFIFVNMFNSAQNKRGIDAESFLSRFKSYQVYFDNS
jgi:hypothetical protein